MIRSSRSPSQFVAFGGRRAPVLGEAPWPQVRDFQAKRYDRTRGEPDVMALLAACSDLQVLQLEEELRQPSLLEGSSGPWSRAWLPPWLAELVTEPVRAHLLKSAYRLDAQLGTPALMPDPATFADAVVRHTLTLAARHWAALLGLDLALEALPALLHVRHHGVAELWEHESADALTDEAALAARGLACCAPTSWGTTAAAMTSTATFERLRSARPEDLVTGLSLAAWRLGRPAVGVCAPATAAVARARRARRDTPGWVVVGGRRCQLEPLVRALSDGRSRAVVLCWQPVAYRPVRETPVLLAGVVIDTDGSARVLVLWHAAVLAVPLPWVVGIREPGPWR